MYQKNSNLDKIRPKRWIKNTQLGKIIILYINCVSSGTCKLNRIGFLSTHRVSLIPISVLEDTLEDQMHLA